MNQTKAAIFLSGFMAISSVRGDEPIRWEGSDDSVSAWKSSTLPLKTVAPQTGLIVAPTPTVPVAPPRIEPRTTLPRVGQQPLTHWQPLPENAPRWTKAGPVPQKNEEPLSEPIIAPREELPPVPTIPLESLPQPQPSEPERLPLPRIVPKSEPLETAPAPRRVPQTTTIQEYDDGGLVWQPATTDHATTHVPRIAPPTTNGSFGSPELSLSRDGTFGNLFGNGLFGNTTAGSSGYFNVEYLLWWQNAMRIPVLASTGPAESFGFLNSPGTQSLLGPGRFGETLRNGLRIGAGYWFGPQFGLTGSLFVLGRTSTSFNRTSANFPVLARPIFATNLNREFAELVAFPEQSGGRLSVGSSSEMWGAEVNAAFARCGDCDRNSHWFAGYRFLNLEEDLAITEYIVAGGRRAVDPPGTQIVVRDSFATENSFHGGQLGYSTERRSGPFDVQLRGSVALGATHQELTVEGLQRRQRPGMTMEFVGGLLAAGPNLGQFDRNRFSVVPEATVNVGYRPRDNVRLYVGGNFLYWSDVIRPGQQIDRVIDLTFVPNAPDVEFSGQFRPQANLRSSDYWLLGVQFGAELRW